MRELDKNYNFFMLNEKELIKKYPNEFIVISNERVVYHNVDISLVVEYVKKLNAGSYIIQKCGSKESDNIQMFHTRVMF